MDPSKLKETAPKTETKSGGGFFSLDSILDSVLSIPDTVMDSVVSLVETTAESVDSALTGIAKSIVNTLLPDDVESQPVKSAA